MKPIRILILLSIIAAILILGSCGNTDKLGKYKTKKVDCPVEYKKKHFKTNKR